ncbi:MAG: alpha/beta fold hydrolase [Burkholderiaceae bacterium]|nr:alpha/beta fold hydrolase [Burkholderiaceae bacterium]
MTTPTSHASTGSAAPALPPAALQLLAEATRLTTPCGDGHIVWHAWGPMDGLPVLLLHGGSGSWTHWLRSIAPLVAAGRRVIVPDLPGFGDSAKPPSGEDADAMPEPLEAGIVTIVGDASIDIVGFSFGGMVAGLWAAAYPRRAARLVLVGPPAMGVADSRQVDLRAWRHLPEDAGRDAIHRHNLAVLMLHDPAAVDDEALALHRANLLRDRLPRRRLARTRVLAEALARVTCPVRAIYGEHDAIHAGHAAELAQAFAAATPHFVRLHWIAGAGHWVQHERPEAFNAALAEALA